MFGRDLIISILHRVFHRVVDNFSKLWKTQNENGYRFHFFKSHENPRF